MFRRASCIGRFPSQARDRATRTGIALHIGEHAKQTLNRAPNRAHGVDHLFSRLRPPCQTARLAGDDRLTAVIDLDVQHDLHLFPAVSDLGQDE
jgi:hypothetical protein